MEKPFDVVLGPNIVGVYNIYEAARLAKARVVFASSNHAIGFHPRSTPLDADCALRPDGYYGLSKAYGELMAGVYWEKHAVQSVLVRIGSSLPKPVDQRMLSTYLSFADLARLMVRCIEAGKHRLQRDLGRFGQHGELLARRCARRVGLGAAGHR